MKKYKCECGTVVPDKVYMTEEHHCPKCGKNLEPLTENISVSEKRLNCPRCNCSYPFERLVTECYNCKAYLDVHALTPVKKDNRKHISFATD